MLYIIISAWALSGVLFWVMGNRRCGWPDRWHSQDSRYQGWDETIFAIIPICMVAGPVMWLALAYCRIKDAT